MTFLWRYFFTEVNLHVLFEDIHWLLLIATNVLTMDCNNIKSSIPSEIFQFEIHQQRSREVHVSSSVNFMSNLGRNCDENKGNCYLRYKTIYSNTEFAVYIITK